MEQQKNWFIVIDGSKIKFVTLADGNSPGFGAIDISGSTAGAIGISQKALALKLRINKAALWDSRVHKIVELQNWKVISDGGTNPECLFIDKNTLDALTNAGIFILFTDGQIDQGSVTNTAKHVDKVSHMPVIMVITHLGSSPKNINISVCAPFIAGCANVLVLSNDLDEVKIINTKGVFEKLGQGPDMTLNENKDSWKNYPNLNIDKLINLELPVNERAPPNCISVGADRYLDLNVLFQSNLTEDEMIEVMEHRNDIILACKTRNILPILRKWLNDQNALLAETNVSNHKETAILTEIRLKLANKYPIDHPELVQLRKDLLDIKSKHEEYLKENRLQIERLKNTRRVIQTTLSEITDVEKSGYSAEILSKLSNRAQRAAATGIVELKDVESPKINWCDCKKGCCTICMNDGVPMALLIRSVEDVEKNTGDWAIDFPLSFGSADWNNVILPDLICYDCANKIKGISTVGREKVKIVLPLVKIQGNMDIWINRLALALTTGIKVNNTFMIFFAIIEHVLGTAGWCDVSNAEMRSNLEFVYQNILENYLTSDTFRDGGNRVPLLQAMQNVCTSTLKQTGDMMNDYPLQGTCLILRVLHSTQNLSDDDYKKLLHNRISRHIISKYMGLVLNDRKSNENKASEYRQKCKEMIFECRFGVPIRNTAKFITKLEEFLPEYDMSAIKRCCIDLKLENPNQLVLPALSLVISKMIEYTEHNSVGNITKMMIELNNLYRLALLDPINVNPLEILEMINKKYDFGNTNVEHEGPPLFATRYGASCIRCQCGYLFLPEDVRHLANEEMTRVAMNRRKGHFQQVFNCNTEWGMPGGRSLSYNLHKAIRNAFNPELTDDENVIAITKYIVTQDKRGNIYTETIENDIRTVLPSYRKFRMPDNIDIGVGNLEISFEDKLCIEIAEIKK